MLFHRHRYLLNGVREWLTYVKHRTMHWKSRANYDAPCTAHRTRHAHQHMGICVELTRRFVLFCLRLRLNLVISLPMVTWTFPWLKGVFDLRVASVAAILWISTSPVCMVSFLFKPCVYHADFNIARTKTLWVELPRDLSAFWGTYIYIYI